MQNKRFGDYQQSTATELGKRDRIHASRPSSDAENMLFKEKKLLFAQQMRSQIGSSKRPKLIENAAWKEPRRTMGGAAQMLKDSTNMDEKMMQGQPAGLSSSTNETPQQILSKELFAQESTANTRELD